VALAIAGVMIDQGWFDPEFVRDWTNGPFLVQDDDATLLAPRCSRQAAWPMAFLLGTKGEERPLPMPLENAGTPNTRPRPIRTVFQRKSNPKLKFEQKKAGYLAPAFFV
jgi:anaerobic selenocysteine-containing dehydrogenase